MGKRVWESAGFLLIRNTSMNNHLIRQKKTRTRLFYVMSYLAGLILVFSIWVGVFIVDELNHYLYIYNGTGSDIVVKKVSVNGSGKIYKSVKVSPVDISRYTPGVFYGRSFFSTGDTMSIEYEINGIRKDLSCVRSDDRDGNCAFRLIISENNSMNCSCDSSSDFY